MAVTRDLRSIPIECEEWTVIPILSHALTMSDDSADERRLFWRRYFHDHPDYTLGNPRQNDDQTPKTYTRGGKLLLYCKECLGRHIAELQREDAEAVSNGTRPNPRTEAEIRRYRACCT